MRPATWISFVKPQVEAPHRLAKRLASILRSGHLTNEGPVLKKFEAALAQFLRVDDVIVVDNASNGLLLACKALGLSGKVVLPSFTYIATLSAFAHQGMTPIFCDIDPETWTMSPSDLRRILSRHADVGAVCPVNVYGHPPDMKGIALLAKEAGAALVYDNAHGFGTEEGGRRVPSQPRVQVFSFHATKLLCGVEGGAIVSADAKLREKMRVLRNHGLARNLLDSTPGFNAKMDELRATVGLQSLRKVTAALSRRRRYAERLRAFLNDRCYDAFQVQGLRPSVRTNFQNLAVVVRRPGGLDRAIAAFARAGVEARRYFYPPLHRLKLFKGRFDLPATERVGDSLFCLPLHSQMSERTLALIESAAQAAGRELNSVP